jgi:hypothetical protein
MVNQQISIKLNQEKSLPNLRRDISDISRYLVRNPNGDVRLSDETNWNSQRALQVTQDLDYLTNTYAFMPDVDREQMARIGQVKQSLYSALSSI